MRKKKQKNVRASCKHAWHLWIKLFFKKIYTPKGKIQPKDVKEIIQGLPSRRGGEPNDRNSNISFDHRILKHMHGLKCLDNTLNELFFLSFLRRSQWRRFNCDNCARKKFMFNWPILKKHEKEIHFNAIYNLKFHWFSEVLNTCRNLTSSLDWSLRKKVKFLFIFQYLDLFSVQLI